MISSTIAAIDVGSNAIRLAIARVGTGGEPDLRSLPKDLILQLHANPNVSLGSGYRFYPGYSAAQVRHRLGIGW